jgi:hypothetical protein
MSARDAGAASIFILVKRSISLSKSSTKASLLPAGFAISSCQLYMAMSLSPGGGVAAGESDTGPEFFPRVMKKREVVRCIRAGCGWSMLSG